MMILVQFIMIAILFAIISVLYYAFSKLKFKKLGYWLLGGYTIILLASVIIYQFIPKSELFNDNKANRIDMVHDVGYAGKPIQEYEQYKKKEWLIDLTGLEELNVYYDGNIDQSITVLIETKEEATSLEAEFYQIQPNQAMGVTTDTGETIDLKFKNGNLIILLPAPVHYEYIQISKDLPFTQLADSSFDNPFYHDSYQRGSRVLYLKVPVGLELQFDYDIFYEYIN